MSHGQVVKGQVYSVAGYAVLAFFFFFFFLFFFIALRGLGFKKNYFYRIAVRSAAPHITLWGGPPVPTYLGYNLTCGPHAMPSILLCDEIVLLFNL